LLAIPDEVQTAARRGSGRRSWKVARRWYVRVILIKREPAANTSPKYWPVNNLPRLILLLLIYLHLTC